MLYQIFSYNDSSQHFIKNLEKMGIRNTLDDIEEKYPYLGGNI